MTAAVADEDFFEEGKMFDGSSIAGWKGINESDMVLMPDMKSAFMDPFSEHKTLVLRCDVLEPAPGPSQLDVWNGDWLNVVADCSQSVQAFLGADGSGVHAAAWCRNPYLAMLDFNGMVSEFILTRVMDMAHAGEDGKTIDREIKKMANRYMEFETFVGGIPDAWLLVRKQAAKRKPRRR